jgi:hypothetical protein
MVFESRNPKGSFVHSSSAGETVVEQRARMALEQAEKDERRQADLAELSSVCNAPAERIRAWERMHGIVLPRDPNHNLLRVIAKATDLELAQVQEEQLRRRQAAPG